MYGFSRTERRSARRLALLLGLWGALAVPAVAQVTVDKQAGVRGAAPPLDDRVVLHVDADHGDDALNDGSRQQPFQTLNHALQRAYYVLNPAPGVTEDDVDVTIRVHRASMPIAPSGYGGIEPLNGGWRPWGETKIHTPFPIRMIDGVDLVGVPDAGGQLPVISLTVGPGEVYDRWTWSKLPPGAPHGGSPAAKRAIVSGANDAMLKGFVIDGTGVPDTSANDFPGVYVANVTGFRLVDCEVMGWRDQVDLVAGPGETMSAEVIGGDYSLAWPLHSDQGHAALWVRGAGTMTVHLQGAVFRDSHDGVEVRGERVMGETPHIVVTAQDCQFLDNENGFEVAGQGAVRISISNSLFCNNYNRYFDGGVPAPGETTDPPIPGSESIFEASVSGFGVRGLQDIQATLRDNLFVNNAQGVFWRPNGNQAYLDMGTTGDPGGNSFCIDFGIWPPAADYYRVCLFHAGQGTVDAVGNWWLPSNQGATSQGYLKNFVAGFAVVGPRNIYTGTFTGEVFPSPKVPGPFWGQGWDRNYGILLVDGLINLGTYLDVPSGGKPSCGGCP